MKQGALWLLGLTIACGGAKPTVKPPEPVPGSVVFDLDGRPSVVAVTRDGDPSVAVSVVVDTTGMPEGTSVALAALVTTRVPTARVIPHAHGYRVSVLGGHGDVSKIARQLRDALMAPATDADREASRRKLDALSQIKLADSRLAPFADCKGALFAPKAPLDPQSIDALRSKAHALGRVAWGVTGTRDDALAVVSVLKSTAVWSPSDAPTAPTVTSDVIYDAGTSVADGAARLSVLFRAAPRVATSAATTIGDPDTALGAQVLALGGTIASSMGTTSIGGGCVAVDIDITPFDARRAALITETLVRELSESTPSPAAIPADPRDAAETVAWNHLADAHPPPPNATAVAIGIGSLRKPAPVDDVVARFSAERDAARAALGSRVLEGRVVVERGQPSTWVLVASTCGMTQESESDAGSSAIVLSAITQSLRARHIDAEPWVSADGSGILASVSSIDAAGVLGRVLFVDPLPDTSTLQKAALARVDPAQAQLASVLAPLHPSWVLPAPSFAAIARSSAASLALRLDALRAEPIRAVVASNVDAANANAMLAVLDKRILRDRTAQRQCPAIDIAAPKPGTYAVEAPGRSEVYLALALPLGDDATARMLAAALDGDDGLLAKALAGVARAWGARVVGGSRVRALVVHVEAPGSALDASVAQVRALFDRLQKGAVVDADRNRAVRRIAEMDAASSLDPRARIVAAWKGNSTGTVQPTLDALRALASSLLRDDALVIVAARSGRKG